MAVKCKCPIRCQICGAKLIRDAVGHKCPEPICQNRDGYPGCILHKVRDEDCPGFIPNSEFEEPTR